MFEFSNVECWGNWYVFEDLGMFKDSTVVFGVDLGGVKKLKIDSFKMFEYPFDSNSLFVVFV